MDIPLENSRGEGVVGTPGDGIDPKQNGLEPITDAIVPDVVLPVVKWSPAVVGEYESIRFLIPGSSSFGLNVSELNGRLAEPGVDALLMLSVVTIRFDPRGD